MKAVFDQDELIHIQAAVEEYRESDSFVPVKISPEIKATILPIVLQKLNSYCALSYFTNRNIR